MDTDRVLMVPDGRCFGGMGEEERELRSTNISYRIAMWMQSAT